MQIEEITLQEVEPRIKPSRSLKALKSYSKRRPVAKDLKTNIDHIVSGYHLPSNGPLNMSDLRLFSIYGVPPDGKAMFLKAKAAGMLSNVTKPTKRSKKHHQNTREQAAADSTQPLNAPRD